MQHARKLNKTVNQPLTLLTLNFTVVMQELFIIYLQSVVNYTPKLHSLRPSPSLINNATHLTLNAATGIFSTERIE